VLDSEVTYHMTNSKGDVINNKHPRKNGIFNANDICYPISGTRDVVLSSNLTLHNTLVVPSMSTKLFSIGQLFRDLNCEMIMFPDYCIF
jgi:hypothetical protein